MYFISVLTSLEPSHKARCLGYFLSKDEALAAVKENRDGLDEGIYDYLVVEKISEGIHPAAEQEIWFRWVQRVGSSMIRGYWEEIPKPPETASFGNHALG